MAHTLDGNWTADMLEALPDDGNHYEIVDGVLYVTPSPVTPHQRVAGGIFGDLRGYLKGSRVAEALPDIDVRVDERTVVRPDVIVVQLVPGVDPDLPVTASRLLLVVEVLSPSSRRTDRGAKRALYARLGVPEYWIVDPETRSIERWRKGAAEPERSVGEVGWAMEPGREGVVVSLD